MSSDAFIFNGDPIRGPSGEEFSRFIGRSALEKGLNQREHDHLIAQLAESHLGGAALNWFYESLNEDIQESWKELKKAIWRRWPSQSASVSAPGSSIFPTPASAPPAAKPPTTRRENAEVGPIYGRIHTSLDSSRVLGYICKRTSPTSHDDSEFVVNGGSLENSVRVNFLPSRELDVHGLGVEGKDGEERLALHINDVAASEIAAPLNQATLDVTATLTTGPPATGAYRPGLPPYLSLQSVWIVLHGGALIPIREITQGTYVKFHVYCVTESRVIKFATRMINYSNASRVLLRFVVD